MITVTVTTTVLQIIYYFYVDVSNKHIFFKEQSEK